MIWIYIFLFCVPLFLVLSIYVARTDKDSHNWSTDTGQVDDSLKNRMQELACCPTTFYDSCEPTIIEKAYYDARLRGEREGFFPVLLTLEENLEVMLLDELGIEDGKKKVDLEKVKVRRKELMQTTENGKDWLDLQQG